MSTFIHILGGLALFLVYYLATPELSFDAAGTWFLLAAVAGVVGVLQSFALSSSAYDGPQLKPGALVWLVPAALSATLFMGLSIASMPMLRADTYHDLLGKETLAEKSVLPAIDPSNAPLVSYSMAVKAAEKKLSEIPALGSQAQIGELQRQRVGNELVWVAFLEHRGLFTWSSQRSTPGYVVVSANDPSDVKLVTEVGGKKLSLRYLESGYFGDDAKRHLRSAGYASRGLADFSPEIDDEGRPYLVVTTFQRRVGSHGHEADGVVVLDVQSGESKFYTIADAPAWVDRIQPESFVREQLADRLEYVNGWLNPSNKDKLALSGEVDLVYGADDKAYFYAGITSVGRDNGIVGYFLVDTRTKEVTRYSMVGVTENVAQAAAQGVNPEKKYEATNALPFMVGGSPAYVMALRDGTGIARSFAVVDLRDYQRVAVADTLPAAIRAFQSKMSLERTEMGASSNPNEESLTAKVLRVGQEVRQGNTVYTLLLAGFEDKLFSVDQNRSEELSVTQVGDTVEITTLKGEQRVLPVLAFENKSLEGKADNAKPSTEASSKP